MDCRTTPYVSEVIQQFLDFLSGLARTRATTVTAYKDLVVHPIDAMDPRIDKDLGTIGFPCLMLGLV